MFSPRRGHVSLAGCLTPRAWDWSRGAPRDPRVAHTFFLGCSPHLPLGGNFFEWAHDENVNIVCKVNVFYIPPPPPPLLSLFWSALFLVTRAGWNSHLSYWLNVKLKLFRFPKLKPLRALLLVGSASALLPLFKAFTVINDGVNSSLACLPLCEPGCNHPFSCSPHPALPGRRPVVPQGRQRRVTPSLNLFQRLRVFPLHTRHAVPLPKSKICVFVSPGFKVF